MEFIFSLCHGVSVDTVDYFPYGYNVRHIKDFRDTSGIGEWRFHEYPGILHESVYGDVINDFLTKSIWRKSGFAL